MMLSNRNPTFKNVSNRNKGNTVKEYAYTYICTYIYAHILYIHYMKEKWKLLSHVRLFVTPWNSPGQNIVVGSLSLLQGIFPTQGSNPGFPHCRQILYQLSHKGSFIFYKFVNWLSEKKKSVQFKFHIHAKSLQLCLTLCNPMDHSPPGSSVHGRIFQARIMEWVALLQGYFQPRDPTLICYVFCIGR